MAGLSVPDADLYIVQRASIAGRESEVECGVLIGGDAGRSETAAEEADGAGEKRALDKTGGDESEGDGNVTRTCRDETLSDGLIDEALVGGD